MHIHYVCQYCSSIISSFSGNRVSMAIMLLTSIILRLKVSIVISRGDYFKKTYKKRNADRHRHCWLFQPRPPRKSRKASNGSPVTSDTNVYFYRHPSITAHRFIVDGIQKPFSYQRFILLMINNLSLLECFSNSTTEYFSLLCTC